MPIHLTRVQGKNEQVVVAFGEERATITYRPDAISNREWREIQRRTQSERADNPEDSYNVAILSRVLVSWDLVWDEEGKEPVGVSKEEMDKLPARLLNAILQAITEQMFPNLKPADNSGSSF